MKVIFLSREIEREKSTKKEIDKYLVKILHEVLVGHPELSIVLEVDSQIFLLIVRYIPGL